jgi:hypothetical protein
MPLLLGLCNICIDLNGSTAPAILASFPRRPNRQSPSASLAKNDGVGLVLHCAIVTDVRVRVTKVVAQLL